MASIVINGPWFFTIAMLVECKPLFCTLELLFSIHFTKGIMYKMHTVARC